MWSLHRRVEENWADPEGARHRHLEKMTKNVGMKVRMPLRNEDPEWQQRRLALGWTGVDIIKEEDCDAAHIAKSLITEHTKAMMKEDWSEKFGDFECGRCSKTTKLLWCPLDKEYDCEV